MKIPHDAPSQLSNSKSIGQQKTRFGVVGGRSLTASESHELQTLEKHNRLPFIYRGNKAWPAAHLVNACSCDHSGFRGAPLDVLDAATVPLVRPGHRP